MSAPTAASAGLTSTPWHGRLQADEFATPRGRTGSGTFRKSSSSRRPGPPALSGAHSPSRSSTYGPTKNTSSDVATPSPRAMSPPQLSGKEDVDGFASELSTRLEEDRQASSVRTLAVLIVGMSLFLDLCLMTALVPIAPAYLGTDSYLKMGLLFGSNAGVQVLTNLFLGRLIDRYGPSYPLFGGLLAMCASTTIIAFAGDISFKHRYYVVLSGRMLQGLSSASATTGGMAWLASLYCDDEARGEAMGKAMTGIGIGALVGPPFGAAFTPLGIDDGWRYPFLILAFLCVLTAGSQAALAWSNLPCFEEESDDSEGSMKELIWDPYIVLGFVINFFGNAIMSVLEATMPTRIRSLFHPSGWELGVIFIPAMLPYILATPISGKYLARIGRYWGLVIGGIVIAAGSIAIPYLCELLHSRSHGIWVLSAPLALCGIGLGLIDSTIMPLMVNVVEKRHSTMYGSACAVVDASVSLAFFLGPIGSSYLIELVSFKWAYIAQGGVILLLAPFAFKFRRFHNPVGFQSIEDSLLPSQRGSIS